MDLEIRADATVSDVIFHQRYNEVEDLIDSIKGSMVEYEDVNLWRRSSGYSLVFSNQEM